MRAAAKAAVASALLALLASAAQAAPARLTESQVRGFVERQSKAWNAGQLPAYFALFTPDARFVERGRAKDGRVVPYGTSTLAEARRQARRNPARTQETTTVRQVLIAPDGRSAQAASSEVLLITEAGRTRRLCGERTQTIVATPHGLRSTGEVDTLFECR